MKALRESVDAALKRAFRPEFLNRIDETIVFHPLSQEQIVQIVGLMVEDVRERLAEREITLELTHEAGLWLAREGFDPVYGARPLRRAIQRQLENPLARLVLSGNLEAGARVVADAGPEGLTLTQRCKNNGPAAEPAEAEPLEPALV